MSPAHLVPEIFLDPEIGLERLNPIHFSIYIGRLESSILNGYPSSLKIRRHWHLRCTVLAKGPPCNTTTRLFPTTALPSIEALSMGGNILVIDPDKKTSQGFRQVLTRLPFTADIYDAIDRLPPELDIRRYQAVIIDLDDKTPSKTTFEAWRRHNKPLKILGISSKNFHPDLSEVIGQHLFACLKKPLDEEELVFFLNSILESPEDDEAPK